MVGHSVDTGAAIQAGQEAFVDPSGVELVVAADKDIPLDIAELLVAAAEKFPALKVAGELDLDTAGPADQKIDCCPFVI